MNWYTVFVKAFEGAILTGASAVAVDISAGGNPLDGKHIGIVFGVAVFGALIKAVKNIVDGSNPGKKKPDLAAK